MAATSTNKQPLLIDRPFLRGAYINSQTPVVSNKYNPPLGDLIQLVRVGDIPSEDGALVESISFISNQDYDDPPGSGDPTTDNLHQVEMVIYVYAPDQANPAVARALMVSTVAIDLNAFFTGEPQTIQLLESLTPVPQTTALAAGRNTLPFSDPILTGKTSALNLEKGYILCVGVLDPDFGVTESGDLVPGLDISGMQVFAQGGFY